MKKVSDKELLKTPGPLLIVAFPRAIYGLTRDQLRLRRRVLLSKQKKKEGHALREQMVRDRKARKELAQRNDLAKKYKVALSAIEELEGQLEDIRSIQKPISTHTISPKLSSKSSEATAVWVASDWHLEERVDPARVNGLNEYSLAIARQRADGFFRSGLRLTNILAKDVGIKTIVLALLGDFFSNDIHEEIAELNQLEPIHAAIEAQNLIASGIQFILDNSTYELVIPCHSGNHARTTKTTRFGAENGHSLEFFMYHFLADHFKDEPRVNFLIADGPHSYLDVYGYTIRFHHGHAIRYGGGIGGIFIPAYKAISQWDKAKRADLTVFGHFHQMKDGGNFICNGSLIGYNAYALSIKADYEKPKQVLFLVDRKRAKTCVWPILA